MWVYIPNSPRSAFAQEQGRWTSPLNLQFRRFVRSFMWNGKPSPPRLWYKRLKRVIWLRRLYGQMPEPSQADAFADSWISSLAESRASPIARPESRPGEPMTAICGQPPGGLSSSPEHGQSGSKTSAECCTRAGRPAFTETYPDLVIRLRQDYSARRRLAPPMSESDCSSSESMTAWPTPAARDHRSVYASPASHARNSRPLSEAAGKWATPLSSDGAKGSTGQSFGRGNLPLAAQAGRWQTPTVADTQGGRRTRSGTRNTELLIKGQGQALYALLAPPKGDRSLFGLPDPESLPAGEPPLRRGLTLNLLFVEALMNWPPGWSGSSAWSQHARAQRLHRLHLLGNGVVPLAAAFAFRALTASLARTSPGSDRLFRLTEGFT